MTDKTELAKLKVTELRDLLKEKGLSTTGKKEELISRLLESEQENGHTEEPQGTASDQGASSEEQPTEAVTEANDQNADVTAEEAKSEGASGVGHEEVEAVAAANEETLAEIMDPSVDTPLATAEVPSLQTDPERTTQNREAQEQADPEQEEEGQEAMQEDKPESSVGGDIAAEQEGVSNKRVYIGKIPFATAPATVREKLEPFGPITDFSFSRGFAFCEYENVEDAEKAIAELNGSDIDGGTIIAQIARPKRNRGGSGDRGARDKEAVRRIYLKNTERLSEGAIRDLCSEFGRVSNIIMKSNFAFAVFEDEVSASKAVDGLNGREVDGATITVEMSKEREPLSSRSRRRGEGGRSGRDRRDRFDNRREGGSYRDRRSYDRYDDRRSRYAERESRYDSRAYDRRDRADELRAYDRYDSRVDVSRGYYDDRRAYDDRRYLDDRRSRDYYRNPYASRSLETVGRYSDRGLPADSRYSRDYRDRAGYDYRAAYGDRRGSFERSGYSGGGRR